MAGQPGSASEAGWAAERGAGDHRGLDPGTARQGHFRGDRLVLFTDGLSAARNADDMEYGTDGIAHLIAAAATCRESTDLLIRDMASFRGVAPQHDDLTVMIVRRND